MSEGPRLGVTSALKLIGERCPEMNADCLTARRLVKSGAKVPGLLLILTTALSKPVWTAEDRHGLRNAHLSALDLDPSTAPEFSRKRVDRLHIRVHGIEHEAMAAAAASAGTPLSVWVRMTLLAAAERAGTWDPDNLPMSKRRVLDGRTR